MSRRTKKVGIAGKYGARYGIRIRKRLQDVESAMKEKYPCPKCTTGILKRVSTGVFECRKCGVKIASSAYYPTPPKAITKKLEEEVSEKKTPEEGVATRKVKKVKKIMVEEKKEEEKEVEKNV
ncbi:MAG: 50S ribosomal protein L37ae [Thermoplasmata archaeon]